MNIYENTFRMPIYPMLNQRKANKITPNPNANPITPNPGVWLVESN